MTLSVESRRGRESTIAGPIYLRQAQGVVAIIGFSDFLIALETSGGVASAGISTPEGPMKVSDLIGSRREVYSIPEDKSVLEAAQYLREKGVRSAGVIDAKGQLVGVVSQSDVSDKIAAENKCPAWIKVSEIMSRNLLTVTPEMTFDESLQLMDQNGVYHLLIVDNTGDYRGMLSVSDLLRVMASDEKARADLLESYLFSSR
jgi:CBS domain-containing protein